MTAASASDNFLDVLGIAPALGRAVSHHDAGREWISAVDISYELWQRHWRGDLEIVGRRTGINNIPVTIADVLPRDFRLYLGPGVDLPPQIDVWYPRAASYDRDPFRGQIVIARLKHGVGPSVDAPLRENQSCACTEPADDKPLGEELPHDLSSRRADRRANRQLARARGRTSLLDDYVAEASADTRFALFVLAAFAAVAVILTGIGVYGVAGYAAARRTREIALRLALGADRAGIVSLVIREGLVWTLVGLAVGVEAARGLTRYLQSLLFHVGAADALTFFIVAASLGLVAIAATAVPAIRAVRVDPMLALRSE